MKPLLVGIAPRVHRCDHRLFDAGEHLFDADGRGRRHCRLWPLDRPYQARGHVLCSEPDNLAFHSRYTSHRLVLPELRPAQYGEISRRLVAFARSRPDRPALFYVGDSELMFLTRFCEALEPHYRFLLPPPAIQDALINKARFIALAREADLPLDRKRHV